MATAATLADLDTPHGVAMFVEVFAAGSPACGAHALAALRATGITFIASPPHDAVVLEAAWQRAVLTGFVDHGWLDQDAATAMLAWPHSGFGAHIGPPIHADDRDGLLRDDRRVAPAP